MPDIASNSYSIAFGDFARGYLVVDRVGIRMLRDPYSRQALCAVLHDQARRRRRAELRSHQADEVRGERSAAFISRLAGEVASEAAGRGGRRARARPSVSLRSTTFPAMPGR